MNITEINIADIIIGEQMIRSDTAREGIEELALDIARNGLMQPIGVTPTDGGKYQLLWGSRRLTAYKYLGKTRIPARIVDSGEVDSVRSVAMRENIHRLGLSLREEVDTVLFLHEQENLSPQMIAERLGKSKQWVEKRLAIPSLPVDLQIALMEERISIGHAEVLAGLESEDARACVMQQVYLNRWTVNQCREAVKAWQECPSLEDAIQAGTTAAKRIEREVRFYAACDACGKPERPERLNIMRFCEDCAPAISEALRQANQEEVQSYGGTD